MTKINKSILEEAKLNYDEIKQFAEQAATNEIKEELNKKIDVILNKVFEEKAIQENVSIEANGVKVEIGDSGEVKVEKTSEAGEINTSTDVENIPVVTSPEETEEMTADDEEFVVVGDESSEDGNEEEIEVNKLNQDTDMEHNKIKEEEQVPAVAGADVSMDAAPAAATEVPNPFAVIADKLDAIVAKLDGKNATPAVETPVSGEVEIVDDEAQQAAPAAPAAAPVQEEEFELDEIEMDENSIIEIVDEVEDEEKMLEIVDEEEVAEGGMGVSFSTEKQVNRRQKYSKGDKHHNPQAPISQVAVNESEVKAQDESKLDELVKENDSLKSTVKELNEENKKFKNSFVELRKQFNEMQTFNGKMALLVNLFSKGGFTANEKDQIAEQFDKALTIKEAEELYKKIIKENSLSVGKQTISEKLKTPTTNTMKSSAQPLYESAEVKRMKELAFGKKGEE